MRSINVTDGRDVIGRQGFPLALVVVGLLLFASGCGQSRTDEYSEYSEVAPTESLESLQNEAESPGRADSANDAQAATRSVAESTQKPVDRHATAGDSPTADTEGNPESRTGTGPAVASRPETSVPSPGEEATTPAGTAATAATTPINGVPSTSDSTKPRKVEILIPEKEFKVEGPEKAIRVSYDDIDLLKVMNMEPVTPDAPSMMPGWLKGLDGKRIRIRGFMYPPFQETDLEGFGLARDNQICCFGRFPKIYDLFPVKMRDGVTANYIQNRPFDVVGVFHIRPESEGGMLHQLYEIDDAIVIDR